MKASDLTTPNEVCVRVGAKPSPPNAEEKLGLSRSARSEVPVHGLRVAPSEGVSGWYVWAGEMSEAEDFFEPSRVAHIGEVCGSIHMLVPERCVPDTRIMPRARWPSGSRTPER